MITKELRREVDTIHDRALRDRCRKVMKRVDRRETYSLDQLAVDLGLPIEALLACLALYVVETDSPPVLIAMTQGTRH